MANARILLITAEIRSGEQVASLSSTNAGTEYTVVDSGHQGDIDRCAQGPKNANLKCSRHGGPLWLGTASSKDQTITWHRHHQVG